TGTNSYSGGTTISSGTLQLGSGGTSGSITGNIADNSLLAFNRSDSLTIAGAITGTGAVQQNGAGTTVLTGSNSYTGGTTISGGILQIGNGGATGSVTGAITDNAAVRFNRSDSVTVANLISGTGSLTQAGSGTLILTGTDTYTGGTTISSGILQIGSGGTAGAIAGNVADNGNLAFNRSDNVTYGNVVSGTGSLTQKGPGTLILTGTDTYTGGTTISGGTLQIGSGGTVGAITGDVADNGILTFNRSDSVTFAGVISGTGSLTQAGSGTLILTGTNSYSGGTTISSGTLQLGSGGTSGSITGNIADNGILAFNRSDTLTIAGAITGTGAVQQNGTGTTFLTGVSTYSGATTVNAGVLSVNGSITSNVVLAGGTLKGSGTVGNVTMASGTTIAPGNSIGTISVGSISFAAGSTYQAEVNAAGQSDLINASGTASLNGTLSVLATAGSYAPVTTYRIINATGGVTGSFAQVTSNIFTLTPSVIYGAGSVDLRLIRNDLTFGTAFGTTVNQTAVGNAVSAGGVTTPLYNALATVANNASAMPAALDSLSGEIHASLRSAMIEDSRMIRDTVLDRRAPADGTSVWAAAFTDYGELAGDGNAAELHRSNAGFIAGVDTLLDDGLRAGLAFSYGGQRVGINARASHASGSAWYLVGYAGWQADAWKLDAGGDLGWGSNNVVRSVAVLAETESDHQANQSGQFFARVSYDPGLVGLPLIPYAGLAHIYASSGAFAETGGLAALSGAGKTDSQTYSTLGLRLAEGDLGADLSGLSLHADLGWSHALEGRTPAQIAAFATGQSFTVTGVPLGSDAATVQLGLDYAIDPAATFSFGYDGSLSNRGSSHAIRGGLNWRM
ncbi:MAG: autotransporter domain-containing protein, partial [Alphaproteobacteria bacterium]|nr:autotransporter domain-containing protein [Alphaproteobacteria bacterium]